MKEEEQTERQEQGSKKKKKKEASRDLAKSRDLNLQRVFLMKRKSIVFFLFDDF